MDGFTYVDGIVAAIVVLSAMLAYSRGLVREIMAIVGWVGAGVVAFAFAAQAQPLVAEIPVLGEIIGSSCELSLITAFAAVFALALVVVSLFTPLLSSVIQRTALNGPDQGLGFLFGVLRGVILVAVGFFAYDIALGENGVAAVDDSRSAAIFAQSVMAVAERDPEQAIGWLTGQYDTLMAVCAAPNG